MLTNLVNGCYLSYIETHKELNAMKYFTLAEYNVPANDEEIIETLLVTVFGETATEVLTTIAEYLKANSRSQFYRIDKMVWSDGFGKEIRMYGV